MLGFIAALPRARRRVARDLARNGLRRERVLAGMVRVLATCFLRPGSAVYAKENGSYGITTLQRRHVAVRGAVVCFDFIGKSGKRQQRELRDRRLAALVRELLRHPGDVFKFRGEDGKLMDVRERHINAYIKQVMGRRFSAKDFRTWAANLLCAFALARASNGSKPGPTERRRQLTVAMREVAGLLGNTPAVCRASYVFSRVIRSHEQGKLRRFPRVDVAAANPRRSTIERSERVLAALLA
jgi:DNA topoisomerase-1